MSCSERSSEPCQQPARPAPSIRAAGSSTGGRNRSRSRVLYLSSITMASTAHLLMSELGDLSLQHGREGAPQRLLRHQAGSTHQLDGPRCAVDHVRPPSTPGWAGTRGYLEGQKTHR